MKINKIIQEIKEINVVFTIVEYRYLNIPNKKIAFRFPKNLPFLERN